MALNQKYTHNNHIALTAPKAIKSGDPVIIGQYAGVAKIDAAEGERVTIWLNGSYVHDTEDAFTEGAPAYLTADGKITADETGGTLYGVSNTNKAAGAGEVEVAPYGFLPTT